MTTQGHEAAASNEPGKSASFTPGPWEVEGSRVYTVGKGARLIATVGIRRDKDEEEANARFIAAAPELLDMLEEAREWVDEFAVRMRSYTISDKARECIARIDTLIAKATGAA